MLYFADLFLVSALQDKQRAPYYLMLIQDVTPLQTMFFGLGNGKPDLKGKELEQAMYWLENRFGKLYKAMTNSERLNEYAVRMAWGQKEYEDEFVSLYLSDPDALEVYFPKMFKIESVLLLAEKGDPDLARHCFLGLRFRKDLKEQITKIAVKRLGETHRLDAGILECLAEIWDRPDLSPFVTEGNMVKIADDLSKQIEEAKKLLK